MIGEENKQISLIVQAINNRVLWYDKKKEFIQSNQSRYPLLFEASKRGIHAALKLDVFVFYLEVRGNKVGLDYNLTIQIEHELLCDKIYETQTFRIPGTTLLRGPWYPSKKVVGWRCTPEVRKKVLSVIKEASRELALFEREYKKLEREEERIRLAQQRDFASRVFKDKQ